MRNFSARVVNLICRPETEWAAIALERGTGSWVVWRYLALLALIAPLAYAGSVLLGGEGALHRFRDFSAAARFAALAAAGAYVAVLLSVGVTALVVWLVIPLYRGRRDLGAAFALVAYAGTPVWLAGLVLVAPLQRLPLLVIVILIALMHALYLFYLGLHHLVQVPQRDAAECAAIVVVASVMLSTVAGYLGSAAGLFPHM